MADNFSTNSAFRVRFVPEQRVWSRSFSANRSQTDSLSANSPFRERFMREQRVSSEGGWECSDSPFASDCRLKAQFSSEERLAGRLSSFEQFLASRSSLLANKCYAKDAPAQCGSRTLPQSYIACFPRTCLLRSRASQQLTY